MNSDSIERIERLAKLRDAGDITDAEYEDMKAEVLGRSTVTDTSDTVDTVPPRSFTSQHGQKFCSIKSRQIPKRNRIYSAPCPFCGVPLPAKNRSVTVTYDASDAALSSTPARSKQNGEKMSGGKTFAIAAAIIVLVLFMAGLASSVNGASSEGSASASATTTTVVTTTVNRTGPAPKPVGTLRDIAIRNTNSLWSKHTGNLLGLAPGEAERIGLWAEGLAAYITDGDGQCDAIVDRVNGWAVTSGVDRNGQMMEILDAWSPIVGVDFESAWNSCS